MLLSLNVSDTSKLVSLTPALRRPDVPGIRVEVNGQVGRSPGPGWGWMSVFLAAPEYPPVFCWLYPTSTLTCYCLPALGLAAGAVSGRRRGG